ncbi:MAG: biotin transporter BioY [Bacillus sp. (in: Bacteria)]|nr:biotin transporter BioY [Bacillus sp. (in: firmicutes)]MCM1428112.1 biotin transporter BioY [Eubacterium sp.]
MSDTMNHFTQQTDTFGKGERKAKIATKEVVCAGMFTAVLAILSQLSIPMPSGVPITLQTFAFALVGVVLSWRLGLASAIIYILLGAVGVPVFCEFSGGLHVLIGYTGGFIWGFFALVYLCGIGVLMKNKVCGILFGIAGLALCHLVGILQFMAVAGMGFVESFLTASAPYLIKDVISVILAFIVGAQIRTRLMKAWLLS